MGKEKEKKNKFIILFFVTIKPECFRKTGKKFLISKYWGVYFVSLQINVFNGKLLLISYWRNSTLLGRDGSGGGGGYSLTTRDLPRMLPWPWREMTSSLNWVEATPWADCSMFPRSPTWRKLKQWKNNNDAIIKWEHIDENQNFFSVLF